jgi:hypothetical protein
VFVLGAVGENLSRPFFVVMTSVFKYLIFGCVVLLLAAAIKAVPQGFLEGHLKIVSLRAVEPSDEMPRSVVTAETYTEYPLIILSQDGQKEIARVTADENGNYRTALPPGTYILDVQGRAPRRLRAKPEQFTVLSNQTVRVDMSIVIGFR